MRKRKNRLNPALAILPSEQGRLPDYNRVLSRPMNLDRGQLIPSITMIQARNCETIIRLQSALKRIAVNKNRLPLVNIGE